MTDIVGHSSDKNKNLNEETVSNGPGWETFFYDGGSAAVRFMCNFTVTEVDQTLILVLEFVSSKWDV